MALPTEVLAARVAGMRTWKVGDVTVVRIESAELELPSDREVPAWAVPHLAPAPDTTAIAFSAFGLVDGDIRIVVDPWLADDSPRGRPDATDRVDGLLDQLGAAGLPAGEVDVVVNTHLDGIGWNTRPAADGDGWTPTFPSARYIWPRAELDAVERGEDLLGGPELAPLLDAGVVVPTGLVDGDDPLPLSPHVALHAAPGHNFGHVAVHVDSGGETAVIPGHLFLDLFSVDDPDAPTGDGPEAPATRRRILDHLAATGGLLLSPFFGGDGTGRVAGTRATGYRLTPL
jgi:glyoxylase-like metal-dependent hydrolase (beta-lactamase superfamily II)